jgi:lysophospholipase L1-like esterase
MKLLFIGDSVTDCGCSRKTEEFGPYGIGYVRRLAELMPGHTVINAGISGNRIRNLQARWEQDCLQHTPDVVTILIGVNDVWRQFDSNDPVDPEAFRAAYRQLLSDTRARLPQTRILLMEPFVLPIPEDRRTWRPYIDSLIQIVRDMAVAYTLPLVPLEGLLFASAATLGLAAVAQDGVHPTPLGHEVIAQSWLQTFRGLA